MRRIGMIACAAALASYGFGAWAKTKVLVTEDATHGIAALPDTLNEWQTSAMYFRAKPSEADTVVTGDDFFLREYGRKLAPFSFSDGYESPVFGRDRQHPDEPAIRFGRGWGSSRGCSYGARIDLEQDADETEWTFTQGRARTFRVKAPKGVRKTVLVPLGAVRTLQGVTSLSFACRTKGVAVKVHAFELVPFATPIAWRGTFVLGFEPWKAGITFGRRNHYVLKVNGETVSRGLVLDGCETLREDVTARLHRGTNVIEVATYEQDGYCNPSELVCEAFAISADGAREMLLGGPAWKARYRTGKWQGVACSQNPAHRMGGDWSPGTVKCFTGINPMHAGPLRLKHLGPAYPVFDCDAAEIAYALETPPGMKDLELALAVSNTLEGTVVETRRAKVAALNGRLALETRKPGPYRLHATLMREGKTIDAVRPEFLIAGPVVQTECAYADYDATLQKRMKLLQTRDCTVEEKDPRLFAEHGSLLRGGKRPDVLSRVRTEDGIAFREAGTCSGDWFGYPLDVAHPGIAHILEVDYPDTHEQTLYVSVSENLPANFCNHGYGSAQRECNATGAVRTGWMTPLTRTRQTMRILFFPASKNVTVTFENHSRAAVCGFRLYEVPEGLPALKLPPTERLWGNHTERPLEGMWGAAACAKANRVYGEYIENAYLAAYLGIRNRIAELRYLGQNLAIEGVYMYKQYFPTLSGESQTACANFDYCYILSKMYRHNAIRAFAGFEYFSAPSLEIRNGHDIGEREMRASKKPLSPSFGVDRFGRQTIVFGEAGLNYLAPPVWNSMTNLLTEIYRRYEPTGGFEGLFLVCNNGWIPGFCSIRNAYTENEVGYDDLSVELFQRETGVRLDVPYAPDRFQRRYELLNGRYEKAWYGWRARKVREALAAFRAICSTGARAWTVYAAPGVEHKPATNPFDATLSTAAARDGYYPRAFRAAGFPYEIYAKGSQDGVRMVPRVKSARELDLPLWGAMTSAGAREMYAACDGVYREPIGLNERWISTATLPMWWWTAIGGSVVFDMKASGTAAFHDLVDICAGQPPRLVVDNWLDVNFPTAHGRESRRFATGFAAMPPGVYRPFPAVTGVQAEICGTDAVRLVNDTPYALGGRLVSRRLGFPASVTDAFAGEKSGAFDYELPPYGITVLRSEDIAKKLSGAFRFADTAVGRETLRRAAALAENAVMRGDLSAGVRARFDAAWAGKDVYRLAAVLRDYEVRRAGDAFFGRILDMPQRPEKDLRVVARYDGPEQRYGRDQTGGCGPLDKTARDTSRKTTLSFLVRADGRPGDMMVCNLMPFRFDMRTYAGREGYATTGLSVSLTCFRTKPGQKGWYSVGMPPHEGAAKGVWHHVCVTIDPETSAAVWVDGRLVDARELVDHHGLAFEPQHQGVSFGRVCPKDCAEAGLSCARIVRRDGVMDWRDIQKEAAAWLKSARRDF